MKRKKKAFLILLFTILAVVVVGTVTVTYAWFLSRYSHDYEFILESQSYVILSYETELDFASGDISTSANVLRPAARNANVAAMSEPALSPIELFDTSTPKVATSAHAVKYTASGAYWTGEISTVGQFSFLLEGYLSSVSSENRIANGPNDLVSDQRNELDFLVIFRYLGEDILYYDGAYYIRGAAAGASFILPANMESDNNLRYWHLLTTESRVLDVDRSVAITDGTYMLLQPNTTFTYTLYAFLAKPQTEMDPAINGERIYLKATLKVE